MAMTHTPTTRKNPTDATLRNVRAAAKRLTALERRVRALERALVRLQRRRRAGVD